MLEKEWLSGTFDRVVMEVDKDENPVSAAILDFKTDQVNSAEEIEAAKQKYRPQLATYRHVLSRMTGIAEDRIETTLLFTRPALLVTL